MPKPPLHHAFFVFIMTLLNLCVHLFFLGNFSCFHFRFNIFFLSFLCLFSFNPFITFLLLLPNFHRNLQPFFFFFFSNFLSFYLNFISLPFKPSLISKAIHFLPFCYIFTFPYFSSLLWQLFLHHLLSCLSPSIICFLSCR